MLFCLDEEEKKKDEEEIARKELMKYDDTRKSELLYSNPTQCV